MRIRLEQLFAHALLFATLSMMLTGCGGADSGAIVGDFRATGAAIDGHLDPGRTLAPQYVSLGGGRAHYKIGPTDVLNIQVFQADGLNRKVQVGASGTVTVPLIGLVQATGRTAQDLEVDIATKLRTRYMQSPQVTVFIEEYNSQKVTVGGAVKKPGIIPVKGDMTLLQAIAASEGLDTVANASNVLIFREQSGTRYVARFDVEQIKAGIAQDPLLQDKDVVQVDSSSVKTAMRDYGQPVASTLTGLGSTATFISLVK